MALRPLPALVALLVAAPLAASLPAGLLPASDPRPDVPPPSLGARKASFP